MTRLALSSVALLVVLSGCAGSQKHAEVPDFTEKGWSDPAPELTSAKADQPIQGEGASAGSASAEAAPAEAPAASAPAGATDAKPAADSSIEAAVVSGNALPPPPATTPTGKAVKGKKGKKGKKKKSVKTG